MIFVLAIRTCRFSEWWLDMTDGIPRVGLRTGEFDLFRVRHKFQGGAWGVLGIRGQDLLTGPDGSLAMSVGVTCRVHDDAVDGAPIAPRRRRPSPALRRGGDTSPRSRSSQ
jgi:hypothetical protein